MTEERDIDYVGPRDAVHERVHEVVKDLVNGRVGQPTRDQIRRALDTSKPAETKSFPGKALGR